VALALLEVCEVEAAPASLLAVWLEPVVESAEPDVPTKEDAEVPVLA